MITEQAILTVDPSVVTEFEAALQGARDIIAGQPGFQSIAVLPALDHPGRYLLLVQWESIAAHRDGFRQSADYAAWKARLHGYYDCLPEVNYYGKSIFDA